MGYREYEPIAARFRVPIVITGFEPIDLLEGTFDDGAATRSRAVPRWKINMRASLQREGNRVRARPHQPSLRSVRPQMARRRFDSEERLQTALRISRSRRRTVVRRERNRHPRTRRLHQRPGFEGRQKAARLSGVRQAMHAGASAGRDDGFCRRRLRRLLRLRTALARPRAERDAERGNRPDLEHERIAR